MTLTPTARVDSATNVVITYTLSAAASAGTQNVGEFSFRVFANQLPIWSTYGVSIDNVTLPPVGSPWGVNQQFLNINGLISAHIVYFESQAVLPPPNSKAIDTTGGMVGSFDIIWLRPAVGQYDAAIGTNYMQGAYNEEEFGTFFTASEAVGSGVSTLITANTVVPEPAEAAFLVVSSSAILLWRSRRKLQ